MSASDSSFVLVDNLSGNVTSNSPQKHASSPRQSHPSSNAPYQPGSAPSYAHDWSASGTGGGLRLHGRHFVDAYNRVCNPRGVNLSGSCKTPANYSHETFPDDPRTVTFVGRPFPLEEAHEHFARLRRWGLTFIRFLVTWEAVEHEGPGIYDHDYLTYLRDLLSLLPQYGMSAFVSLHQDVWSRYTGGSGAPAWTVEAVGFDLDGLEETGAAWLNGMRGGGHNDAERGLWPTGYTKLAAATMATCFWAGDTFAPKLLVNDKTPIQDFLQDRFLDMWEVLVRAVGGLDGVIGFQMMNEPNRGYVNLHSMYSFNYNVDLHLSHIPSPFQSFQLGAGYPTRVPVWTRSFPMPTKQTTYTVLNTGRRKAWRENGPTKGQCLWAMHGVWGWCKTKNQGVVLRENYFTKDPISGNKIDWYTDFYFPFLKRWSDRVRSVSSPNKIIFAEAIPNEFCPPCWIPELRIPNMVYAPHWYDLKSLFEKAFGNFTVNVQGLSRGMFLLKAFYWGHKGARDNFTLQIANLVQEAYNSLGETPVLIGECGIPMDMNRGEAFVAENFTWQKRMMDAMLTALDRALVGFTLWNYNPHNDDQLGDDWNGENFSWFSRKRASLHRLSYAQDSAALDSGARILDAVVRPYPAKTAGIPLQFNYEMTTGEFTYSWVIPASPDGDKTPSADQITPPLNHPQLLAFETEIFLPSQLAHERKVIVEGNAKEQGYQYHYDEKRQTLFLLPSNNSPGTEHQIRVRLSPPPTPAFKVNSFWEDWGWYIAAVFIAFFSILCAVFVRIFGARVI